TMITSRPPGTRTRRISRSAAARSGKNCKPSWQHTIARRVCSIVSHSAAQIEWHEASADKLPFSDALFNVGRLAAQYRDHSGGLPSQTLRRVRGGLRNCEDPPDETFRLTWGALQAAFTVAPGECDRALEEVARAQN